MPRLVAIAAVSDNGIIGRDNALPWEKLPRDMARFISVTKMIGAVVMGRKTADSLGKPLPGRTNYVLSRDPSRVREGFIHVQSLAALQQLSDADIAVIGGSLLYAQLAHACELLHLTRIHSNFEGDARFPASAFVNYAPAKDETFYPADAANAHDMTFYTARNLRVLPIHTYGV
jgi:dihydrofolate reductase